MKNPKVGDRVAVYGPHPKGGMCYGSKGEVTKINPFESINLLDIKLENSQPGLFHEKQCRRLVKRPRRRVWIHGGDVEKVLKDTEHVNRVLVGPKPFSSADIEFIEVRKRK